MANTQRNFIQGRMNKSLDERLVPQGEHIDALNVRLGSTEDSEIGSVENSKGNTKLTSLEYVETGSQTGGVPLSSQARCLGVFEDGSKDRIYWFVHDPAFTVGLTKKLDLIVSLNPTTNNLAYHVISIDDGSGVNTTLNFNPSHLVTAVNKIEDLLFFTDNFNPPRVINVLENYPFPNFNLDVMTAEELLVIKKPPINAPLLTLKSQQNNQDDFLKERFICFAYRYQYANGEFSATSQWTEPAFDPGIYRYSFSSNLNEGMVNTITGIDVVFNSGSELVKAVEILYKENTDNTIKIIDKLDKSLLGYADNTDYSFAFNNSKIFTILPSTELLRLYDNVPLRALAQTIMGNRLVYGNYYEGYDLVDIFSNPIQLEFAANLIEAEITNVNLTTSTESGTYTFGSSQTIAQSVGVVDMSSLNQFTDLKAGTSLNIDFTFEHSLYDPTTGQPTTEQQNTDIQFAYNLPEDYTSVFDLVSSADFQEAIGTASNIKPVYDATNPTSCSGFTLTDSFNCSVDSTQTTASGTVFKYESGITSSTTVSGEPIAIIGNSPGATSIKFQVPAMRYVTDVASPSGGFYEYYKIISITATFNSVGNPKSLHSNRGYEIGIVYMDEFLRSSTALVSPTNTIQIPCANSRRQNQIHVTIPWGQRAPQWAKHYKFVLKPDQSTYETIYSETFFADPLSSSFYFLLEGENAAKIEAGQRLIVKADSGGAVEQCVEAVVIDKKVQSQDFLKIRNPFDTTTPPDPTAEGYYVNVPAGPYMEIVPNGFNVTSSEEVGGNRIAYPALRSTFPILNKSRGYPVGMARVNIKNPDPNGANAYVDYSIPVDSKININIFQNRQGGNSGCERRINTYSSPDLYAQATYTNFQNWFEGDNIAQLISQGSIADVGGGGTINNVYLGNGTPIVGAAGLTIPPETIDSTDQSPFITVAIGTNYYNFWRSQVDNSLWFLATGTLSCKSWSGIGGHASNSEIEIVVERANSGGVIVFETVPSNASPDIWYENDLSFTINDIGEHNGNLQPQNIQTQTPAIINTNFFNCFTFGNGVESYTIRDSIKGEAFTFGNRVTTTAAQDYREAHRFADLTYSGIYNDESNINKLNEFNLGLVNYKGLEDSFASIQLLYARKDDILTLQEDKISYVLTNKDLLTDADGSGSLTSVPTVLGKQIPRIEEFGISRNPESFAVFGADKFFTDEQRGAVILLKGTAYNNETLNVISEQGMRGWFRDMFHDNFDSQKLGGFDPYMNEYVLSANSISLPFVGDCDLCGTSRDLTLIPTESISYCVNVTQEVGTVNIDYVLPTQGNTSIITQINTPTTGTGEVQIITETNSAAASGNNIVEEDSTSNNTYTITVLYNGLTFTTGPVKTSGTLAIDKNSVYADTLTVTASSNSITSDTIEITTNCPEPDQISIYQVSITSNADRGKFIHNEYRWTDGLFVSPIHSELVEFNNGTEYPLVSQFTKLVGSQGAGVIPDDGAQVTIISNKIDFDDFEFDENTNNFRYLRTATFYGGTSLTEMAALLAASTTATPINNRFAPEYSAYFNMPAGTAVENNLYLIWDYRKSTQVQLCYSAVSAVDACCTCAIVPTPTATLTPVPTTATCTSYTLAISGTCTRYIVQGGISGGTYSYTDCDNTTFTNLILAVNEETSVCAQTSSVTVTGTVTTTTENVCGGSSGTFSWQDCSGTPQTETVPANQSIVVCSQTLPIQPAGQGGSITAGAVCIDYYYRATLCTSGTVVFLSGSQALGLFKIGDIVQFRDIATGNNLCATINAVGIGNGGTGKINLEASGCADSTNCPSATTTIYQWRISSTNSAIPILCSDNTFCDQLIFTYASSFATVTPGVTQFYRDRNATQLYQGTNKFYALAAPSAGSTTTGPAFRDGVLNINDVGTANQLYTCP
tara:strand:+ start:1645 stop:7323 length:5679 start_codon:yes stop_codon:yes gene_type:complete